MLRTVLLVSSATWLIAAPLPDMPYGVWWETRQPNLEKWFVTHHPRCDAPEAQQRLWQLGRNRQELFVQPLANVLSKHIAQLCQQPGLTF